LYHDPRIVAVIGHLTSGTTLAAAPIYNGGSTPLVELTPTGSSPAITNAGPYTFRTCPTDLVHGVRLAEWARDELGAEGAAILYENDDYGRGARNAFAGAFINAGGTIITDDPVVSELPSLEPYVRRIAVDGGVDVLAILGSRGTAERVIPILDSIGLDLQLLASAGVAGIERSTVDAFGLLLSSDYFPDRPGPRNAAFVDAYRTAHRNELPDHRAAGTYDAVMLLAEALRAAGPTREAVRTHLEQVGNELPPFEGVAGAIAFDANGDAIDKQVTIGVVATTGLVTVRGQ
jgi:branched-chain amino acid transport system substrate-binding protein